MDIIRNRQALPEVYEVDRALLSEFPPIFEELFVIIEGEDDKWLCISEKIHQSIVEYEILRLCAEKDMEITSIKIMDTDLISIVYKNADNELSAVSYDTTYVESQADEILQAGIEQDASDIHIVRKDNLAEIIFRCRGELTPYKEYPASEIDRIVSVLYNVLADSRESTWNRNFAQDANIMRIFKGQVYRFRYAHMPIYSSSGLAYHMVVRILYTGGGGGSKGQIKNHTKILLSLGFTAPQVELLKIISSNPSGLFIVAGTTGSGKTTSIKCILEWLYTEQHEGGVTILTVEDPVELGIEGAIQSSVVRQKSSSPGFNPFAAAINSAMRRDPDILMVGEVRDPLSANQLVAATESGHFAVTTLHAASVLGIVQRLESLGVPRDRLSSPDFFAGMMYQKLIKTVCRECAYNLKEAALKNYINKEQLERICEIYGDDIENILVRNPEGCPKCDHSGSSGRQVCAEILRPDNKMLSFFQAGNFVGAAEYLHDLQKTCPWGVQGYTAKDHVLKLVKEGVVCPKQAESTFGRLNIE